MPDRRTATPRVVVDTNAVITGGPGFEHDWVEHDLLLVTLAREPGQTATTTGVRLLLDPETAEQLLGTLSEALHPAATPVTRLRAIPGGA